MTNRKRFHVFLSHNSADKPAVEELAQRLQAVGLEPWLDKWNLVPGDAWQPALEEALRDSAACAVFVGPSGFGAWQHEEMRAAIARRVSSQQKEDRFPVIPVLLPGAVRGDRSQLPEFLTAATWVEFRRTLDDDTTFRILERAIHGLPPGPSESVAVTDCPYRGLEFFDVQHAPVFFGRAAITDWLLSALRGTLSAQGPTRFLAIIGASGSGKSSLARAGLLAALKNGGIEGSADWLTTICRPGPSPLESLADALAKTDSVNLGQGLAANLIEQLKVALRERPNTLHQTTRASLGDNQPARRLLVLVDQFEELFTVCRDDVERHAFIGNLLYAARVAQGQTIILLTMRADFYGKFASYPELSAAISEHQFLVGPLTIDELREAIERPAQLAGCEFEPGLVELLVEDVLRQPGALPLLQYGLLRMWNTRTGRRITTADYLAVGQLEGIIEKRAEEVFKGFTEPQQELCRRLFLRLTEPGEGTEDTKRRVSCHELISTQSDSSGMSDIVKGLADERLVTTGGSTTSIADSMVEVAHETLIRKWKRLRDWIEADRAGLRIHRRLTEAAEEWKKNNRDPGLLEHGTRLAITSEWREKHPAELSDSERDFLTACFEKRDHDRQKEERRIHEKRDAEREYAIVKANAELARQREDKQRAASKKLSQFTVGLVVAVAVISGLAIIAWTATREARVQLSAAKHILSLFDIANAGFAASEGRIGDATLWYEKTLRDLPLDDPLSQSALCLLGSWSRHTSTLIVHDDAVSSVAFSPDGQMVLTGSDDQTARVWDAYTGQARGEPLKHDGKVLSVAFSPDGQTLLTGSDDKTARLWDARTGQARGEPLKHDGSVLSVAFSPDSQTVLTGSADRTARLWHTRTGQLRGESLKHDGWVSSVAFSPDGQTVLTGSNDKMARLWDAQTGEARGEPLKHDGSVLSVAFSPDSQTVLTGSADTTALLWDTRTGQLRGEPLKHDGAVWSVAFSPDGESLVTGSGNSALVWDVRTGLARGEPLKHGGIVHSVAFNPDGQTILTGSADRTARVLHVRSGLSLKHSGIVRSVAFNPDGRTVLTGSEDNTAMLWDARTGQARGEPLNHDGPVLRVAFSPDGQTVLTGSEDKTARLWDADTGQARGEPLNHDDRVLSLAFSPDGQTVLTGSADNTARLWDAHTGQARGGPMKHDGKVLSVAFSPDGQTVLTGSLDNTARLWDADTGQSRGEPLRHDGWVSSVAFSPDGQTVLTGSMDKTARLWDARTGQSRGGPLKHDAAVLCVAFSPDGQSVLTGGMVYGDLTGEARRWDTRTGQARGEPLKHESPVFSLVFSPDGQTILTGSYDKTARLWDARTGHARGEPLKHDGIVWSVAFSPDGQTVLTGSDDKTARLWDVPPPAADEPERLRLSVQVRTGSEFDEDSGTIRRLTQAEWLKRQARLWKEFGGPCDVRTWDQVSDEEKRQLRAPPKAH